MNGAPRVCVLVKLGDGEERGFVEGAAGELDGDGQSGRSEAAGDGNDGQAGEVAWAVEAQQRSAHRFVDVIDADLGGADGRSCNGRSWRDDGIDGAKRGGEFRC